MVHFNKKHWQYFCSVIFYLFLMSPYAASEAKTPAQDAQSKNTAHQDKHVNMLENNIYFWNRMIAYVKDTGGLSNSATITKYFGDFFIIHRTNAIDTADYNGEYDDGSVSAKMKVQYFEGTSEPAFSSISFSWKHKADINTCQHLDALQNILDNMGWIQKISIINKFHHDDFFHNGVLIRVFPDSNTSAACLKSFIIIANAPLSIP